MKSQLSRRNFLIFIFCLALVQSVAIGIGSGWRDGALSFAIVMGFWLLLAFLPANLVPSMLRPGRTQDEREKGVGMEALSITAIVMVYVSLGGAMWEQATTGDLGAFGVMATVGGLTFLLACVLLPRFR